MFSISYLKNFNRLITEGSFKLEIRISIVMYYNYVEHMLKSTLFNSLYLLLPSVFKFNNMACWNSLYCVPSHKYIPSYTFCCHSASLLEQPMLQLLFCCCNKHCHQGKSQKKECISANSSRGLEPIIAECRQQAPVSRDGA